MIKDHLRFIKIHQQTPGLASIGRCMDLAVERADIQAVLVLRVDRDHAHVTAAGPDHFPIAEFARIGDNIASVGQDGRKIRKDTR